MIWIIKDDGEDFVLTFGFLPPAYRPVAKLVAIEMLGRLNPTSVLANMTHLEAVAKRFGPERLMGVLVGLPPHRVRYEWLKTIQPGCSHDDAMKLKGILHSLCVQAMGPWTPDLRDYVAKQPTPKKDSY